MTDTDEFCPNCGVMAMITYASQGKMCCAMCGTEVDKRSKKEPGKASNFGIVFANIIAGSMIIAACAIVFIR